LAAALTALEPTDVEQARARRSVLAALPNADPSVVGGRLAAALTALVSTDEERAEARTAVLAALPTAEPRVVHHLVAALRSVSSVQSWLAWLANNE
jgi:hypothetical protein